MTTEVLVRQRQRERRTVVFGQGYTSGDVAANIGFGETRDIATSQFFIPSGTAPFLMSGPMAYPLAYEVTASNAVEEDMVERILRLAASPLDMDAPEGEREFMDWLNSD